jgi:hypothetical protein
LLLLRRYAYPVRLRELSGEFCLSIGTVSDATRAFENILIAKFGHIVLDFDSPAMRATLPDVAAAAATKGCPVRNAVAAVDGVFVECQRPEGSIESLFYNGHYARHGVKLQGLAFGNGRFFVSPPFPGSRHDAGLLAETRTVERLFRGHPYAVLGDAAYPNRPPIQRPLVRGRHGSGLSSEEKAVNASYSKTRIIVEWMFGMLAQSWPGVLYRKANKTTATRTGIRYIVAALLVNIQTSLRGGNQITDYFATGQLVEPLGQLLKQDPRYSAAKEFEILMKRW